MYIYVSGGEGGRGRHPHKEAESEVRGSEVK